MNKQKNKQINKQTSCCCYGYIIIIIIHPTLTLPIFALWSCFTARYLYPFFALMEKRSVKVRQVHTRTSTAAEKLIEVGILLYGFLHYGQRSQSRLRL